MTRRFPAPWTVEQIPGGFKVLDANGRALVYVYARETREQADIAKVLTFRRGAARCGECCEGAGAVGDEMSDGRVRLAACCGRT
jgi:hypothetical protein